VPANRNRCPGAPPNVTTTTSRDSAQTLGFPVVGVDRKRPNRAPPVAHDKFRKARLGKAERLVAGGVLQHYAEMEIRDAVAEDAPAACQVLRRSISELCVADHGNDPTILMRWLSNKIPEIVASWMVHPANSVLVAVERETILAVGAVTDAGEITLNYVSPDARFRGVSRSLLGALEARAIERDNARCMLTSTETARRFYHANGYAEDRSLAGKFGGPASYAMSKLLVPGSLDRLLG
jgi:GNAT superfamily N-acetyltransferase